MKRRSEAGLRGGKMTRFKWLLWPLYGALFGTLFMGAALADPLEVSVDVIEAEVGPGELDPRLRSVTQTLRSTFPKYKRFKLQAQHRLTLSVGQLQRLALPSELGAEISLEEEDPSGVTFKVLIPQKKANFRVRSKRGELFFQALVWQKKTYLLAIVAR
jgi:hypothetical protein